MLELRRQVKNDIRNTGNIVEYEVDYTPRIFFDSIKDAMERGLELSKKQTAHTENILVTLFHVDQMDRGKKFCGQEYIAFDFDDCQYISGEINPLYEKVIREVLSLKTEGMVVNSGHGIHFIVRVKPFDETFFKKNQKPYKALVQKISDALKEKKLPHKTDLGIFAPGRTTRINGSINQKDKDIDRIVTFSGSDELVDFDLVKLSGLIELQKGDALSEKELSYFKIDTQEVIGENGCKFVHYAKENAASINEPEWYALASILGRLDTDGKIFHEYSKDHPDYDFEKTERKRRQAIESSGPRTCQNIENLWGGCATCPWYKKIASPVSIKSPRFIASEHSGFHLLTAKGGLIPQFNDLRLFYDKQAPYVTVSENGEVYKYTGTHYEVASKLDIEGFAQDHFKPFCDNKKASEFRGIVERSNRKSSEWFYASTEGLMCLKNGVLNIKTGELLPHSPEYGFRYCSEFSFDKSADAPEYRAMLSRIINDADTENLFLDFAAYAMFGGPCVSDVFLMLIGPGGSGKSTIIEPLEELMRGAVTYLKPKNFENTFILKQLEKSRLNICEEVPRFSSDEFWELLKDLSQGGSVQADVKFKSPIIFKNRAKFILLGNNLPGGADPNEGFFRRCLLIETTRSFTQAGIADNAIGDKIVKNEMPGILNLVLTRIPKLVKSNWKIEKTKKVKQSVENYAREIDPVTQWCENNLQINGLFDAIVAGRTYESTAAVDGHPFIKKAANNEPVLVIPDLKKEFKKWADDEGFRGLKTNTFVQRLRVWGQKQLEQKYGSLPCDMGWPDKFVDVVKKVDGKPLRVLRGFEATTDADH